MGYSPWGHKESDMTEQLNTFMMDVWHKNSNTMEKCKGWGSGNTRNSTTQKLLFWRTLNEERFTTENKNRRMDGWIDEGATSGWIDGCKGE